MASKVEQKGYSCEFVELPPEEVQVKCPVCQQIIRKPYLVSCCGHNFCKGCIEQLQTSNKPCSSCKAGKFTVFPNKGLQRTLSGFNVRCSNQKKGCEWTGKLGHLDTHLNLDPPLGRLFDGCAFAVVKCIHCSGDFRRNEVESHQKERCPKRPYSCEYCEKYKTNYEDVTKNHWTECGSKPVECPNNCGNSPRRQELSAHISNDCPLTLISCDFPGCELKLPRKDIPKHHQNDLLKHMSLLAKSNEQLKTENESLKRQVLELKSSADQQQRRFQSENQALSQRISGLEAKVNNLATDVQKCEGDCTSLKGDVIFLRSDVNRLSF